MKDITLGQFFPGNSIVHRLDPRTKILCLLVYIVVLFMAKGYVGTALVAVILVTVCAAAQIKAKTLVSGLKPLVFMVAFTAVINLFFGTGEPIFKFWVFKITESSIKNAILMVCRVILLVCGTLIVTYTTSPLQLTDALERLLNPLKKLHLPIHELAMMMSIALRFIPTLVDETNKIMSAQKARGANFETGSLRQRAKALMPLLIPLFVSAFRRADELATAMECRCYRGGVGRTRMKQLRMKKMDVCALCLCAIPVALQLCLRQFGL